MKDGLLFNESSAEAAERPKDFGSLNLADYNLVQDAIKYCGEGTKQEVGRNMIYFAEYEHPLSFHNETIKNPDRVVFPTLHPSKYQDMYSPSEAQMQVDSKFRHPEMY